MSRCARSRTRSVARSSRVFRPAGRPRPPVTSLRTLVDAGLDQRCTRSNCTSLTTGPMVVPLAIGWADALRLSRAPCDRHRLVMTRRGHEHARRCVARLAAVAEARVDARGHGRFEIGVVEKDVRRLAAEFLMHALDRRRRELRDLDARARRTGERHHVDVADDCDSAAPTVGPSPFTRLNTPGGTPAASRISANRSALSGDTSLGLSTIVQPAAIAGATLQTIWLIGQFHGVISATTPTGS